MATPVHRFGDIVLVPFPFTDQTGAKKRPAVVISSRAYNNARRDLIIMAVTTQLRPPNAFGEIAVDDWKAAGLLNPSAIKPVITTIEQTLVIKRLGLLSDQDREALKQAIGALIG